MKATELLLKHHRDIEAILRRLHDGKGGALPQELAAMVVAHTTIEQELLYPALRDALPEESKEALNQTLNEALEEKGVVAVALARLLAVKAGDETASRRHRCGDLIVVEWNADYGDGRVYRNVSLGELREGRVVRVTDYWGEPFVPPAWREGLAERELGLAGPDSLTAD